MSRTSPRILFTSLSAKSSLYNEVLCNARSFCQDALVIGCDCNHACEAATKVKKFIQLPRYSLL